MEINGTTNPPDKTYKTNYARVTILFIYLYIYRERAITIIVVIDQYFID